MTVVTSASGFIHMLEEEEPQLKIYALRKLDSIVDEFWPEISEAITKIEILHESKQFPHRELASLVASKVYYHLGAFEESLSFALGAGALFDVNSNSQYVETTLAKCIDHYTKLRVRHAEGRGDAAELIDPRLEAVVDRMFQRCFDDHQFKQALGIALETRRMDIFERAIKQSDDVAGMLSYAQRITMSFIENRQFRNHILRAMVGLYRNLETPDFVNVCQCLIFLDDPPAVAEILDKLVTGAEESILMAYQIAFDLYESATQQYLTLVLQALKANHAEIFGVIAPPPPPAKKEGEEASETEESKPAPTVQVIPLTDDQKKLKEKLDNLENILGGETSIGLHLQFLIRSNRSDLQILKLTKDTVRSSICHTATVIANSFMHAGTTSDVFLRDNLDWLARATNWAKFTATASLGVIHMGHEKEALNLMASYLPRETGPGSGYSEGGGLFALGLIHVNHGREITTYLLDQLKGASNEVVRHGGCLGVGLAAMGTHNTDVYETLRTHLYQDDAITGEAAGIAIGLVMLGSKSETAIEEMVQYAQETQHEKILRGLAVGIALTMYGRLEEADALIENLCQDKDPVLRRSGMYTVAMAYCGTGNNRAIRRLLHVAVSDVNDDVRRAAVTALGFLLFRNPEQCPSVVSLLSESYNPHVRCGAAMALGIACAGTGSKEAIGLLEPMTNDPVNYVRQGALIASALILIQQTEALCPKVRDFRQLYSSVIADKHDDVMAKFGAILAQGIIDAGGRNVTVSLQSRHGHTDMVSVVGMLVFTQFWFWFPLSHFLSLAFTPTCLIGLNLELKMPKMEFRSNAKPSLFAYPPPLEEKKEREREKVTTAVLSITAKQKKKEAEKKKEEKMEVDEEKKDEVKEKEKEKEKEKPKEAEPMETDTVKAEPAKEQEPSFQILPNPSRALRQQLKVISLADGSRYTTLKDISIGGIIMLKDTSRDSPEELVEPLPAGGPKPPEDEGEEPEPPEPFEYVDTD